MLVGSVIAAIPPLWIKGVVKKENVPTASIVCCFRTRGGRPVLRHTDKEGNYWFPVYYGPNSRYTVTASDPDESLSFRAVSHGPLTPADPHGGS